MRQIRILVELSPENIRAITDAVLEEMARRGGSPVEAASISEESHIVEESPIVEEGSSDVSIDDIQAAMARAAGRLMLREESPAVIRSEVFKRFGITSIAECPERKRNALLDAINEL